MQKQSVLELIAKVQVCLEHERDAFREWSYRLMLLREAEVLAIEAWKEWGDASQKTGP